MDIVAELVSCYRTKIGSVNPWFTRRMRDQPKQVQQKVWAKLEQQGDLPKNKLTESDWDWLSRQIIDIPCVRQSIIQRANKLLQTKRPDIKKRLTYKSIRPLLIRIEKSLALRHSDEDILEQYGDRILELLPASTLLEKGFQKLVAPIIESPVEPGL